MMLYAGEIDLIKNTYLPRGSFLKEITSWLLMFCHLYHKCEIAHLCTSVRSQKKDASV